MAVRGAGRVELAAYGLADAEHQVEKELRALWPDAVVELTTTLCPAFSDASCADMNRWFASDQSTLSAIMRSLSGG